MSAGNLPVGQLLEDASDGKSSGLDRCACAHGPALHLDSAGPCAVSLPPYEEEELPAWRCPCPRFRAAPAGPWRWHAATQTWALAS